MRSTINDPRNIVENALTYIKIRAMGSNRGVKFFIKYEKTLINKGKNEFMGMHPLCSTIVNTEA